MKSKDILTLVISGVIIVGCLILAAVVFFPSSKAKNSTSNSQTTSSNNTEITIDREKSKEVLDQINSLKKYGETTLDNIGRVNPFAPID